MERKKGKGVSRVRNVPTLEKFQEMLLDFYYKNKRYPFFSEMKPMIDTTTKSEVFLFVKKMIAAGYLIQPKYLKGIQFPRKYLRIPFLGSIGTPSSLEEVLGDLISFDEWLLPDKREGFLFVMNEDSMQDAFIKEGDVILAKAQKANEGDMVVMNVEGVWKLGVWKEGKLFFAHKKYPPIAVAEVPDMVVKTIIRNV